MMSVIDDIMLVVCIFVRGLIYQNIRGVPLVLAIICMYISLKCTCPYDQWSVRKFYLLLIFCVMILLIIIHMYSQLFMWDTIFMDVFNIP